MITALTTLRVVQLDKTDVTASLDARDSYRIQRKRRFISSLGKAKLPWRTAKLHTRSEQYSSA